MSRKVFTVLRFLLLLAIAGGLLYFAFRGVSLRNIYHEMLQANIWWLLVSILAGFVALVSRAYRWNLMIEPLGYSPSLRNTTYAVCIGYFANLAFPRLGEVTRCGSLSKAEAVPFSSLLGTVIIERVVDVISLLICLLLTAILEFNRLGDFLVTNILNPIVGKFKQFLLSPVFYIAVIILIAVVILLIRYLKNHSKGQGKGSRVAHFFKELINGLRSIAKLKRPWLFVFHSILIWGLYYLSAYFCFFALDATSELGLAAALFVLVIGGIAMSAPVQGGIGIYHLLVSQGLLLYGLSKQDGLAFATLVHSCQLLLIVISGSVSLLLIFLDKKKAAREGQATVIKTVEN